MHDYMKANRWISTYDNFVIYASDGPYHVTRLGEDQNYDEDYNGLNIPPAQRYSSNCEQFVIRNKNLNKENN